MNKIIDGLSGAAESVINAVQTSKSNKLAKEANQLAKESNDLYRIDNSLSEQANEISSQSNDIAQKSLEGTLKSEVPQFDVRIKEISFTNDAFKYSSINQAMEGGAFKATFSVTNIGPNDARSVMVLPKREFENDGSGKHIDVDETAEVEFLFQSYNYKDYSVLYRRKKEGETLPEYDMRTYSRSAVLSWKYGAHKCACDITFEFNIEEADIDGFKGCRVYVSNKDYCESSNLLVDGIALS